MFLKFRSIATAMMVSKKFNKLNSVIMARIELAVLNSFFFLDV